jgi:hypothetical protein
MVVLLVGPTYELDTESAQRDVAAVSFRGF